LNIQSNSNQGTSTVVWAINATYSPGQYAMHFESGNYYWDWSGNYGGGK
jgi:hypothetical protein